ncbi:hypothetical protein E1H99_00335 [Enterococcus hirae]|nr:hypothetical protein E1H99_00335 [Enterococcus hirae]
MMKDNEGNYNEFATKANILALALALKDNEDRFFRTDKDYQLLFSTYIRMIDLDKKEFFIEKERKNKVMKSLERTIAFYDFKNKEQIQSVFEEMVNNDPTDFMIFPSSFYIEGFVGVAPHYIGLTVYKKNNRLIVMKVDKERHYDYSNVTCFEIPLTKMADLSQLFFWGRDYEAREPYYVLSRLAEFSSDINPILALSMKQQTAANCMVNELEASLKTTLFNCRVDISCLNPKVSVTPKWNPKKESTLEMRRRFLLALKGDDPVWNQHFDYIFDYYLCRKGKLGEIDSSKFFLTDEWWYRQIRSSFSMDPYIPEILECNGHIPVVKEDQMKENIKKWLGPRNKLRQKDIRDCEVEELIQGKEQNSYKIKILNARLLSMKIELAREVAEFNITCLREKNKEIDAELQRRKEIDAELQQRKKLEMKAKEFEKRMDMLVLALSLKENERFFKAKEEYQLLFSTYIKMIRNDQDSFFIGEERKAKIIQSLKRTKAFYQFKKKKQLQAVFEKLKNDDPTDFMLFPTTVSSSRDNENSVHLCGFTVYKKNEHFLVMKVDKERSFDNEIVTCFKIPFSHIAKLSQLFWRERDYIRRSTKDIFKSLKELSSEIKAIPITMQYEESGEHAVSKVEDSLKTILFNCRTDIFNLTETPQVILKWNLAHSEPTIEMRKRFVTAMKGEDEGWNQHFDYLFDYYLCGKGKLVSDSSLDIRAHDLRRYWEMQETFSMDLYIPEMLKNGGQMSTKNTELSQEKIIGIDSSGLLNKSAIKEINSIELGNALEANMYKIKLFNERLPFIHIQRAREITLYIISRLEDKNKEIEAEIQRRKELEMKAKEFEKRVDMLVLALSLKENDRFFKAKEEYQLLFSTYIKMIENDHDNFFIEKEQKEKIIQSLERTKALYDFEQKEQLQAIFEKMGNDDPTDFMLFLSAVSSSRDNENSVHLRGFTVYKKNEHFLVMKVDKQRSFDNEIVTYFKIPFSHIAELSQLFLGERGYVRRGTNDIFKSLKELSSEVKVTSTLIMQYEELGEHVVSEVEDSLKTILFNCRTDIFNLSETPKVILKWNLAYSEPTIEMRKRFVTAMKGEDEGWNQHFDYLFDYYLCGKRKLVSDPSLDIRVHDRRRYWKIQETFSMDPYIPEMLKNGGQMSTKNTELSQEKIIGIDPSGLLNKRSIKEINSIDLEDALEVNRHKIKLFNERLPFIKIQRAREITLYIISRLKDKNKEIDAEIKRRKELEMKAKEFEKRVDMLVLALSLKENDRFFKAKEEYQLLFSTYIKMIENDHDNFFIEKERKEKIIQSLERAKALYDFEQKEQLQTVFEKMRNNDPTDFMLFLSAVSSRRYNTDRIHLCGFTVYKKNEHFLVMKVDKQRSFDNETVTCFVIPSSHIAELSQLFSGERGYVRRGTNDIFKSLKDLSIEVKAISAITMKYQEPGEHIVSEVEASLRMILFNCRTDIFSLSEKAMVNPKWNLAHSEPTIEMRKRFVTAMQGEDEGWNQHFDYLFDYYLCRKGKLVSDSSLTTQAHDPIRYLKIQKIFSMDPYISEMLKNGGQISTEKSSLKEEKIREIDPTGRLYMNPIREMPFLNLKNAIKENEYKIKLFNERLPFIKIQRAEEITQYIISRLEDKNKEIGAELQQREEIEKRRQNEKSYNQALNQLVSKNVSESTKSFQKTPIGSNEKDTVEKSELTVLKDKVKIAQHEFRNSSPQDVGSAKKRKIQIEK